jgi:hypothetical protein
MLDLIIKAIIESTRDSRRAEESRRAWEQQRAWEEQQRLWQAQQLQWTGGLEPQAPAGRAHVPPPVPRSRPVAAQMPPESAAAQRTTPAPAPRRTARLASATAPAVAQWMRPETLRSQFILTEILKPPLALRPPRV